MSNSTSAPSANPVPPDTPAPEESGRREAFQVLHPEVGFAVVPHCEEPGERWVAYWLAPDGKPRHVTGATLGAVLDSLAGEFG